MSNGGWNRTDCNQICVITLIEIVHVCCMLFYIDIYISIIQCNICCLKV